MDMVKVLFRLFISSYLTQAPYLESDAVLSFSLSNFTSLSVSLSISHTHIFAWRSHACISRLLLVLLLCAVSDSLNYSVDNIML